MPLAHFQSAAIAAIASHALFDVLTRHKTLYKRFMEDICYDYAVLDGSIP